jgi:peptide/nickel transport system substrate-binding protein
MKNKRLVASFVLLVMLLTAVPVLGADYDHLRGGQVVLRIGTGINHLIPGFETHVGEYDVTRLMYDAPFQWIHLGEYRPQLGESWEMLEENTIIRITLRDDINWYDGTPITSEDLYFSWHYWNSIPDAGPEFGDNIKEIVVVDERTVEFHLTRPNPNFFDNVARQAILPKHLYEDIDPLEIEGHPWMVNPPIEGVSGPFYILEHVPNERIVLARNENWHGRPAAGPDWPSTMDEWPDTALLDRIIFLSIPDADTARLMFEKGELDVFQPAAKDVDRFLEEAQAGKWGYKVIGQRGYTAPMLNHRDPILADVRVRRALVHALDFDTLIEVGYGGKATRAILPVAPQMWVYSDPVVTSRLNVYDYDVEEAKRLLAEAGYPNGITLTMKMNAASDPLIAETMQYMWSLAGINVNLEMAEWGSLLEQVGNADYQIAMFGWATGGFPAANAWSDKSEEDLTSGWQIGYINPRLHELQEQIDRAITREEKAEYFAEAFEIWTADVPILMMVHGTSYWFWNPRLKNFDPTETDYTITGPVWYVEQK